MLLDKDLRKKSFHWQWRWTICKWDNTTSFGNTWWWVWQSIPFAKIRWVFNWAKWNAFIKFYVLQPDERWEAII